MNIKESLNRGFNLLAVSISGLAGFAFLPEVFVEKDMPDKVDDFLLFIIGIIAMSWYMRSNNRYARSAAPLIFIIISLVVKVAGLLIELDDPASFGDDIGGVILLVLSAFLIINQYKKTGRFLASQ